MDWNDVRFFLALARSGSVRGAGGVLGVSHSTVLRRVEALEKRLATRLFDRNREGYFLTEAGHRMLPGAKKIETELAAMERALAGTDERLGGPITLTLCDHYVADLLMVDLAPFTEKYPDIELRLLKDGRFFDLAKREADIAVRALGVGGSPPEFLIGQKLAPIKLASYVGRAHAHLRDPDVLGSTPRWLAFEERAYHEALVAKSSYPDVPLWGAFSTTELLVRGALNGYGIAVLPTYVGDQEPGLRRLEKPDIMHVADIWILSHPDLRENARFARTRAHIAESFKRNQALFEGA